PDFPLTLSTQSTDAPEQTNLYMYSSIDLAKSLTLTIGGSSDFYRRRLLERNQFNPKLGVIFRIAPATTLRIAALRTLNRALVSSQTIEPTQVAGFNQLYADRDGTEAHLYGLALDHTFGGRVFGGGEFTWRSLSIPVEFIADTVDLIRLE